MVGPINRTRSVAPTDEPHVLLLAKLVIILVTAVMATTAFHFLRTDNPLWPGAGGVTVGSFMAYLGILAAYVSSALRR